VVAYWDPPDGVRPIDERPKMLHETGGSFLDSLTGTHAIPMFYALFSAQRPLRFIELEAATGTSPNVLSGRLRAFVEAGLVTSRSVRPEHYRARIY